MADYKYLEDGTPVTASELNSRFASLLGGTQGVNEITPDMLSLGALRHNHIPSLVGKKGQTKDDLEGGFTTASTTPFFTTSAAVPLTPRYNITARTTTAGTFAWGDAIYRHVFNDPITKTSAGEVDAHAIVLLANVHVNRFAQRDGQLAATFKDSLRERALGVAFQLVVEYDFTDASGAVFPRSQPLPNSTRGTSPGLTIDRNSGTETVSGYPMATTTATDTGTDRLTFKDVPLRAVFRLADVPLSDNESFAVTGVRIDAVQFGRGSVATVARVDKINLTAIPLHAKVTNHV